MESISSAVIDLANKHFGEYKIRNGQVIPKYCPICGGGNHGDKETFAVGLYNGCWSEMRGSCEGINGYREGNFKQLCNYFGEVAFEFSSLPKTIRSAKKAYTKPDITKYQPITEECITYLSTRGISSETIKDFKLMSDEKGNIVFPFYRNKELVYVKYRKPKKHTKEDGPKEWQEPNTEPILFGMDNVSYGKPLVITEGECFPGDAEIMTRNGWIRLEDYAGQEVLQVHSDLSCNFETPKAYINKRHKGELVDISIGGNYYSSTTPDHNLVYVDHKKNLIKAKAKDHVSAKCNIPTAANFDNNEYALSNDMIALMLAISADGTIDTRKNNGYNNKFAKEKHYARFGLKKERKIDRLTGILDRLGIKYVNNPFEMNNSTYHSICFSCPDEVAYKYLPWDLVTKTSIEQKKFIIEEMVHWDGNRVTSRNQYEYCSIIKHNADVIQAVASTCGYMSTIMKREIGGKNGFVENYMYKVSILLNKRYVSTQHIDEKKIYHKVDQSVYCVTMPSGMILVRQHDCISVSGNCDALALYEAGVHNVVSVPCGCQNTEWITLCWDWLERFNEIILFGDSDEAGMGMISNLVKRLGEDRCMIPKEYPELVFNGKHYDRQCKDANEILCCYGPEGLKTLVDACEPAPIKGVLVVSAIPYIDPRSQPRIMSGIPKLDMMIGGFGECGVTVVSGMRGEGKSTVSSGFLLNAIQQGYSCCAYSAELSSNQFLDWTFLPATESKYITYVTDPRNGKRICQVPLEIQNRIRKWLGDKLLLFDNGCAFEENQQTAVLRIFEMCARRYGCKLFLVDNLMMIVNTTEEENKAQANFMQKIKAFANKYKVHVICVCHPRKKQGNRTFENDDVAGNSVITNIASTVFSIEKPNIRVTKNRDYSDTGFIHCDYDPCNRRIFESGIGDRTVYGWDHTGIEIPEDQACLLPEFEIQHGMLEEEPL